ncbi:MAG TPA: TonB-dependent receptor [Terriglobales bacterium]|nr:TonB-dependent receptor [Terriglobales bacterium]
MRTNTKTVALLFVALLTFMLAGIGMAQEPTATLVGRVTDTSHASILDAEIKIRNVNTNQVRTARSGSGGEYTVSNLLPGVYEVTIDKAGFKQLREANLELKADQTARLDAPLELGAVSQTIEVNAQVPLINTETSSKGDVVAPQEIAEIPLNGRDFNDLAFTVPGVQPGEQGAKGSAYVTNGARADASNVIIDGFNDQSARDAGVQVSPPLDALQEFKFQTSGYSAEYGRLAGGVVNMLLKSGGNRLHASLFEFVRNDMFDARNFFDLTTKNKLRRNQFGGTLTGPVVIPKLYNGHDRTFFMVSWESQRQVQGSPSITVVPTLLERQGNFSQSKGTLKSPFKSGSCKTFTGSQIPATCISPVSQALLNLYPLPNLDPLLNGGSNYIANNNNVDNYDNFVLKVDQRLGEKDNLSVHVIHRSSDSINPTSGSPLGTFGSTTRRGDAIYGISETRIFTPTLINEFHVGLTRSTSHQVSADAGTNFAAQLGIPGTTNNPALEGFPSFSITGFATVGDSHFNPIRFTVNSYDLSDVVTWNKGKHTIKIGGEILRVGYFQPTNDGFNGVFSFKKTFSGVPFADFLLGLPDTTTLKTGTVTNHIFSNNYAIYVQDDYKVLPSLTLNLGVRYEVPVAPYEKDGQFSNYVPATGKVILGSAATVPNLASILAGVGLTGQVGVASDFGLPKSTVHTDYKAVAPRIGFAWRPFNNNQTVVRGGYGIFYTGSRLSAIRTDISGGFPFSVSQTFTGSTSNPGQITLSNPFPSALAKDQGILTPTGFAVNAPEPYLQSWNFTIERELGKGVAIEAGYTGSKGTHLGRKYDINQQLRNQNPQLALADGTCPACPRPFSNFYGDIEFYSFGATSNYNAGTVTLRKQSHNGLSFRANYTYGKSIDENSGLNYAGDGGFKGFAQDSLNLRSERGRSDFDIRHVFSTSVIYQLPFTRNIFVRGWQLAGTGTAYSGQPFTPVQTQGFSVDKGQPTRPDRIASGTLSNPSHLAWFNLAAFQIVPLTAFRYGNSGRNILDGPGSLAINLSVSRNFSISEYGRLQFRWEAFNLTNHTNFQLPNTSIDTAAGGSITKANAARVMQLALIYRF